MNKGSRVRILGIAALISTTLALPHLLANSALAGDSGSSADSVAPPELNIAKLVPQVSLAKPTPINLEGDTMTRYLISVENYKAFDNSLFQPATYLKPLAEHLNSSRAWVYVKDQDGNPLQTFGTINNREQLKTFGLQLKAELQHPARYM